MKRRKLNTTLMVMTAAILSLAAGSALAVGGAPMTPELAAKSEMVRKQQEQRVTPEKRKAAAEALKAERLKIHQAKKAAQQSAPSAIENK